MDADPPVKRGRPEWNGKVTDRSTVLAHRGIGHGTLERWTG